MNCYQNSIRQVNCDIQEILRRIEPIEYVGEILVINSPISVENAFYIDKQPLTSVSGKLHLPGTTKIDGVPLNGLPFTGDILDLPPQTSINNFAIFTTNYFYFFNSSFTNSSGNYIYNSLFSTAPSKNIEFPFFAPEDCILSSFLFTFAVGSSAPSTIVNATGYIDIIDTLGNVTYTGISVTIPTCPRGTKYYADKSIQYSLPKGYSAGVRYTFSGTAGSWTQFAVLGYKFIPPI